jgi:hypothetical protein
MKKVDPYNVTKEEMHLLRINGWVECGFDMLPQQYFHPSDPESMKDAAEAIEIILNNMRETAKQEFTD